MKTKNIFLYPILLACIVVICTSCADDLDILPPQIVEEDYFKVADNAFLSLMGCYDVIGWEAGGQLGINTFFGDIMGKNTYKGGANEGDQSWMNSFMNFTYDNNQKKIDDVWTEYYVGIGRCNHALKYIPGMTDILSADTLNLYVSELHFIRGYFYFQLVQQFGEVPLVDHLLSPSEYNIKKSSKDVIYSFIESEMLLAEENLPDNWNQNNYGRATKGAAQAFRAKTYLYQKNWPKLKLLTDKIIMESPYSLENTYDDIFLLNNEESNEIIFSIQYAVNDDAGAYGNGSDGSQIGVFIYPRALPYTQIGGWGFNCPTKEFADEFETNDVRADASIIYYQETLWQGTSDEYEFNNIFVTNIDTMNCQKYTLPQSQRGVSAYSCPINWIMIRYAEVLLWDAEAEYHEGGNWQESLGLVRARAGLTMDGIAQNNALESIYHERRVELGLEGHYFWDVVRQGRGEEVFGEYGFQEGVHNHLPIPKTQIDLNGGY